MNKAVHAFICWLSVWKNASVNENADKLQTYMLRMRGMYLMKNKHVIALLEQSLHRQWQLFMAMTEDLMQIFGELKKN